MIKCFLCTCSFMEKKCKTRNVFLPWNLTSKYKISNNYNCKFSSRAAKLTWLSFFRAVLKRFVCCPQLLCFNQLFSNACSNSLIAINFPLRDSLREIHKRLFHVLYLMWELILIIILQYTMIYIIIKKLTHIDNWLLQH